MAQTITVLGVGKVAMDIPLTGAAAQLQVYKAYVPATNPTAITVTATCTGATAPALCTFPLAQLNLPVGVSRSLAVSSSISAADGTLESAKVTAPFALLLAGPPAAPAFSATPIQAP
jgi:hypothetical protein